MTLPRAKLTYTAGRTVVCADCSDTDPAWASLNRGVLICSECCSIHRTLGRHISNVKSLKRSAWNPKQLALVYTLYAHGSNNVWEHVLHDPVGASKAKKKPEPHHPLYPAKAEFIRAKYQNLSFALRANSGGQANGPPATAADLNRQLHSCVRTSHVEATLRLLVMGADPCGYVDPETGAAAIHVAAREGQELQVELLVLYGADVTQMDYAGMIPCALAASKGHKELAARLVELQYELTDRLIAYLCNGRKPDHQNGQHFVIPELDTRPESVSKQSRRRMQALSDSSIEKLAQDVHDEVDRREVDSVWSLSLSEESLMINDRYVVPFLPVNADLPPTRNQRRQKLAKLNGREFASLVIDFLAEAKRRLSQNPQTEEKAQPEPVQHKPERAVSAEINEKVRLPKVLKKSSSMSSDLSDGPVYDVVAIDDDAVKNDVGKNHAQPTAQGAVTIDDFIDLKCQLAAAEALVDELQKRNSDVSNEMERMRLSMDALSQENRHLKTASYQYPSQHHLEPELLQALQTLHSPASPPHGSKSVDALASRHSDETFDRKPPEQDHIQPSLRTVNVCKKSPKASSSSSLSGEGERNSVEPLMFPDNLVFKTEQLTAEIHQLLGAAQNCQQHRFAYYAARIQAAVDNIVQSIPLQYKNESIEGAAENMVEACILLTVRCSSDRSGVGGGENIEKYCCHVVQSAYEVAKAAKALMLAIQ